MNTSKWPEYLPGWDDHIYAIGMVSLNYGQLEGMFGHLFAITTGMTSIQVDAFFQRLQNDARVKVFNQLLSARADLPDALKEALVAFVKAYEVCATNRNAIMHSKNGGRFTRESDSTGGLVLEKVNRDGVRVCSLCTLADLRRVADEIHAYMIFAAQLISDVRAAVHHGKDDHRGQPRSSLDRPTPPQFLDWRPLSDYQSHKPQPGTSQG